MVPLEILPDIEHVLCALCGSKNTDVYLKANVLPHRRGQYAQDVWDIVKCKECGLIYLNPRPGPRSLASLYSFENPGDMNFVQEWFIENADIQRSTWQRILGAMRVYCPGGKLLDVGCGAGSFLESACQMGFTVEGQEVSPYFYKYVHEEKGLTVHLGELEDVNLIPHSYDCITAFDVIEHHPDPNRMLQTIHHLLKPDGLLVIGTHDIGSWFARLHGNNWRYISPTGHLTYFSRKTLASLVVKHGYKVVRQAGFHTVDINKMKEFRNSLVQAFRLILIRGFVIYLYKPISERCKYLTRWEFRWRGASINHDRLIARAGKQIAMNDNLILFARSVAES